MRIKSAVYLGIGGLLLAAIGLACNLTARPARNGSLTPTGCPPPACAQGEIRMCPGNCPNGCGIECVTPTAYITRAPDITYTPFIYCTAPACQPGEVYSCAGACPGGCGTSCATPTPYVTLKAESAITPQMMCTPPACRLDQAYFCSGQCPGGCGTTCATITPPAPGVGLCPLGATRTPPPGAPTLASDQPSQRKVDPHVEVCASQSELHAGDTLTLEARSVDIGLPYFNLHALDSTSGPDTIDVELTYDHQLRLRQNDSRVLEFLSAEGNADQARFTLRARAAGLARVWVSATGEIHYGYPGPATYAGGGSDMLLIRVVE